MAASIICLEQEADELRAEVALLREQARIITAERDEARLQYRSTLALAEALAKTQVELKAERDAWHQCAKTLADAVDYYHPALRDVEDGFSAERAAIARFDELEVSK